jgi:hypothetical protein
MTIENENWKEMTESLLVRIAKEKFNRIDSQPVHLKKMMKLTVSKNQME